MRTFLVITVLFISIFIFINICTTNITYLISFFKAAIGGATRTCERRGIFASVLVALQIFRIRT